MRAVLLAAGLGMRLRPLTDRVPKCMIPLSGEPLLLRNVKWLRENGIADLAVNLHHLPEVVEAALGDGSAHGVRIHYVREPMLLGTAGTVSSLRDWLGDDQFLVVYADNIFECHLDNLLGLHERRQPLATLALHWRLDVNSSGVTRVAAGDRIVSFVEKPGDRGGGGWVFAGLIVCEPRMVAYLPSAGYADFGRDVFPDVLGSGEVLAAYRMREPERILWIDSWPDLERAERVLAQANAV